MSAVVNSALAGPKTARYSNIYGALANMGAVSNLGATDILGSSSPSASAIILALGGADYTPLADYSNCWTDSAGTTQATKDSVVGKIASTVGSWVATQATEGFKPILRDKFSYAPITSSSTSETWTFTGTPIAGRAGIRIDESGEKYFASINTAGNYASTPDSAATSLTGDQTHIFCIAPDSWDNDETQYILGKFGAAGQRAFVFNINSVGSLILTTYSADGSTAISHSATTKPIDLFSARQKVYFRAVLDVDNGASGHDTDFAYSTDYNPVTKTGTWIALGTKVTTAGVTEVKDVTANIFIGAINSTSATNLVGKIYYYAAYANAAGTGTPAFEFYPQRDCTDFPMNPYLDYDGTDDRLETNIAPGSYDAGYLCGGWTQMEALGNTNSLFGSTGTSAVRGTALSIATSNKIAVTRRDGTTFTTAASDEICAQFVPFVGSGDYAATGANARLNSYPATNNVVSRDYRGSTQVALLGASNNAESGVTATNFMQGSMFSQIWLPEIPTDEQQAILRAYCASTAGVTL